MVTKFEVQSRKKPKLNHYMDIMDFQIILISGMVIPFLLWYVTGISFMYSCVLVLSYIFWMMKFKVDKPDGYWTHWLSFKIRGKAWTCQTGQLPPPLYQDLKFSTKTN